MRGNWKHDEPRVTQECPEDNTSRECWQQIREWKVTGTPVHPEVAMEIAAWWQGPQWPAITMFASTGTIDDALLSELSGDRNNKNRSPLEREELDAVIAYVRTVKGEAPDAELLIEVIWNPTQRSYCVKARASSQSEWNYFDGDETELDSLLAIARDVMTGGE